jgi:hypothetical protein
VITRLNMSTVRGRNRPQRDPAQLASARAPFA